MEFNSGLKGLNERWNNKFCYKGCIILVVSTESQILTSMQGFMKRED